jgi:hypothetical protein
MAYQMVRNLDNFLPLEFIQVSKMGGQQLGPNVHGRLPHFRDYQELHSASALHSHAENINHFRPGARYDPDDDLRPVGRP